MSFIEFGQKINLSDSNILPSAPGAVLIAYNLNGLLSQKTYDGVITVIGTGGASIDKKLYEILDNGNRTNGRHILLDEESIILGGDDINIFGTIEIKDNHSGVYRDVNYIQIHDTDGVEISYSDSYIKIASNGDILLENDTRVISVANDGIRINGYKLPDNPGADGNILRILDSELYFDNYDASDFEVVDNNPIGEWEEGTSRVRFNNVEGTIWYVDDFGNWTKYGLINDDNTLAITGNVIRLNVTSITKEFNFDGTNNPFNLVDDFASVENVYIQGVRIGVDDYTMLSESEIEINNTVTLLVGDVVVIQGTIFIE